MEMIAESINMIPGECIETIKTYASLIHTTFGHGKKSQREEMSQRLRGYLTCLVDLGLLTETDFRNLYLWVILGHLVGEKAGMIDG